MKRGAKKVEEKSLRQMKFEDKMKNAIYAVVSILIFLFIWQFGTRAGTRLGNLIPQPTEVFAGFFDSFIYPIGPYTLPTHILWSFSRVFVGYTIAAVIGIVLGIMMGWSRMVEAIFRPLYEMIRPIPPIAWIPISIVWFGIGEGSKYFIIFLGAFTSLTMNAYAGAKAVDSTLAGAAKMLGASKMQVFRYIVLPSAVPNIFVGLQIALSSSWGVVLAAEMIRSSEGLGWVIISGQSTNNVTQIIIGIITVGIVGFICAVVMRGVEAKLCAWNERGR